MNSSSFVRAILIALGLGLVSGSMIAAREPLSPTFGADQEEHFVAAVWPLLKSRCMACHGDDPEELQGALDLRTFEAMQLGGDSGEAMVVVGDSASSPLWLAIGRDSREWAPMPPKESDQFNTDEMQAIAKWIDDGAVWPSSSRMEEIKAKLEESWSSADGVRVETSGGLSAEWTNRRYDPNILWAYRPLNPPKFPEESHVHPIDRLVEQRLAEVELPPAPLVDRATLIRRASYDLLGLPPTPQEVSDFVNDPRDEETAFADLIDRLLESPHYGEQWAKHWLDVVRYADSSGFANDYERGNAWRYRDYVVRAFNDDKPYDQFVLEQIAGDDLDPDDPEMKIAVGMLRMGPWELTGMEVAKVARQRYLDDVTDAVGQVFLAHMLQCARCHDHKFDPIPTRDYYSFQSFFATTQLAEMPAPFLAVENLAGFDELRFLQERQRHYQASLRELSGKVTIAAARQWLHDRQLDADPFEAALEQLTNDRSDGNMPSVAQIRNRMTNNGVHPDLIPPRQVGFEPIDFGMERIGRKGLERLRWRMERYQPFVHSVYDGRTPDLQSVYAPLRMPESPQTVGSLEQTAILTGGDPFSAAETVEPAVLSAVKSVSGFQLALQQVATGNDERTNQEIPTFDGRRLWLAKWIADAQNPLTARVMVNRVWQWHMGQPLADQPNNFGATGTPPTHPELLDWLAARLIEEGWSIKSLHREIMLSRAYRRASQHPDPSKVAASDPNQKLYAVFLPRRLDAEEIRDSMLFVTGELNAQVGGIPARPEINLEAALQPRMVMGTFAEAWQPSPLPEERHRRSLYALRLRGQRDPFLEVFNAPNSDVSCDRRESSTVTPQVFAMFNSEITYDRALAFAARLLEETDDDRSAIDRAFELAFGRKPTEQEAELCRSHWEEMEERHQSMTFPEKSPPLEVVRHAVEENTGTPFSYVEPLEFYKEFVADLKPSEATPRLRGLAEVCLVLLNSNEFVYVY